MPREVEIQIERSNYVQGKIFENIRDEDPGIFKKIINNTIDYTIRYYYYYHCILIKCKILIY